MDIKEYKVVAVDGDLKISKTVKAETPYQAAIKFDEFIYNNYAIDTFIVVEVKQLNS